MHSIFQNSISQNTKCADIIDFPRDGHIWLIYQSFYSYAMILSSVPKILSFTSNIKCDLLYGSNS